MTLAEIDKLLPNGFHDADLMSLTIDYVARTVGMKMELSYSGPDDGPEVPRYKPGTVLALGLHFCILESPCAKYDFNAPGPLWVSGYETKSTPQLMEAFDKQLLAKLPSDAFVYTFFVHDWNAFIHISADSAEFAWDDGGQLSQ